jgi:hypothetical protein
MSPSTRGRALRRGAGGRTPGSCRFSSKPASSQGRAARRLGLDRIGLFTGSAPPMKWSDLEPGRHAAPARARQASAS